MKNPFFGLESIRSEPPPRIYALFDQQTDETIYLDTVDANWFDDVFWQEGGLGRWRETADYAPVHVLELPRGTEPAEFIVGLSGAGFAYDQFDDDSVPLSWLELRLNPSGENARIYYTLFGQAFPVGVDYVSIAPAAAATRLERAFDLSEHTASQAQIAKALSLRGSVEWIGVYDVGQGNMNGLCDLWGLPLTYFDLGGGVLANTGTFPAAFRNICFTMSPRIILSHWDWDHWSSAARFPQATSMTWIVPNQQLGAVHAAMAATIAANGSLLVWPPGLASVTAGQVTVEKCLGTVGRNHSGLAVLVDGPLGEKPILLTGDARYSAIPSGTAELMSIVAAHHGADMRSKATPICSGHSAARIAYSYGPSNTFGHPRACTFDRHHANAWPHRSFQPAGAIDRHAADLRPGLGHIALGWNARAVPPGQPCGGTQCSLQLVQR